MATKVKKYIGYTNINISGKDIAKSKVAYNKFKEERGLMMFHRNYKKKGVVSE